MPPPPIRPAKLRAATKARDFGKEGEELVVSEVEAEASDADMEEDEGAESSPAAPVPRFVGGQPIKSVRFDLGEAEPAGAPAAAGAWAAQVQAAEAAPPARAVAAEPPPKVATGGLLSAALMKRSRADDDDDRGRGGAWGAEEGEGDEWLHEGDQGDYEGDYDEEGDEPEY